MDRCFFFPKDLFETFHLKCHTQNVFILILTYAHNPSYLITKNRISTISFYNRQVHTNYVRIIPNSHIPRHGKTSFFVTILRFSRRLHTRSVMCSNHIAATKESSQASRLGWNFLWSFSNKKAFRPRGTPFPFYRIIR